MTRDRTISAAQDNATALTQKLSDFARRKRRRGVIRATYDAAQTTNENTRHWTHADALSISAANSPAVRSTLRKRARYEVANNTYARGIVTTLANDVIGSGPRLQVAETSNRDNEDATKFEQAFARWAREIKLAKKLRIMRMARAESGEAFGLLVTNPRLAGPVKLDIQLIETDQIAHATGQPLSENEVDGITFDSAGNVITYHMLDRHPGDSYTLSASGKSKEIPARQMLHYLAETRPGQYRGIPDITAALPLFALLRRYTLATVMAAETAANFSAVIESIGPADEDAEFDAFDAVDLERNMATVLPYGYKLGQLKAEQPTTSYNEFKREILNEIARVVSMPFNVAAGNSAGYNYASGRLDHQTYDRNNDVDRSDIEVDILAPIVEAWRAEASRITGHIPQAFRIADPPPAIAWHWDERAHVDPQKHANGQATRLETGVTSLPEECASAGKDWRETMRQRAIAKQYQAQLEAEYGVSLEPAGAAAGFDMEGEDDA